MKISKLQMENLISKLVKEEVDKALSVSDKRRKEFQATFSQVFTEADANAPAAPQPDPTAPPADPNAPPAPPTGSDGATPDATSGAPGMDSGGAPGANGETDDSAGDDPMVNGGEDSGSSGGGFGGFGGGGGGGSGGGMEDEPSGAPEPEADETDSTNPMPEGDPIASMVSGAQELLNQTNDPNLILKSLKGQIQTVFKEPEHALGLVKALYDTNDSLLQSVAERLYLFLKTSRPI